MPKRSFENFFGIFESGGSLSRKVGSGRPREFLGSDRRRLAGIALKKTKFSSQQIAHRFERKLAVSWAKIQHTETRFIQE